MKNELDFLKNRAMTNRRKRMPLGKRILYILLIYIPLFFLITSISAVIVFKYVPVKYTPLMAIRSFEHRKNTNHQVYKTWVPISEIAPEMMMSVMILEDMRFIAHSGFDLIEIDEKMRTEFTRRQYYFSANSKKRFFTAAPFLGKKGF